MTGVSRQPVWSVGAKTRSRARSLRRDSTDVERLLWNSLRAHRLDGAGFRHQAPIGPFIADFVCHDAKLIVELDGGQHYQQGEMSRDARRDTYLASQGFRVLRFSNLDVMHNRSGVLEIIAAAIANAPSLTLTRRRGRGPRRVRGETGAQL